jgi:TfoX/Sxy family transcriptional regulator of competence genes
MGYDQQLAERVHAVVAGRDDISEKPMFGGLCLLAHGNMFAGIQGDTLMARVGTEHHDEALARPHARIMDFSGRPMRGYVYVDPPGIASEAQLRGWVELSLAFVDTLPAK